MHVLATFIPPTPRMSAFISRNSVSDKKMMEKKKKFGEENCSNINLLRHYQRQKFLLKFSKALWVFLAGWTSIALEWDWSDDSMVWGHSLGLEGHRLVLYLMPLASEDKQSESVLLACTSIFSLCKLQAIWQMSRHIRQQKYSYHSPGGGKIFQMITYILSYFLPNPVR